jgi:hypothetical protein
MFMRIRKREIARAGVYGSAGSPKIVSANKRAIKCKEGRHCTGTRHDIVFMDILANKFYERNGNSTVSGTLIQ